MKVTRNNNNKNTQQIKPKYPKKYIKTKHLNYLLLSTATILKEENRYYMEHKTLFNVA